MLCYRCGSHVPDGNELCPNCGQKFTPGGAREDSKNVKPGSAQKQFRYKAGDTIAGRYKVKAIIGSGEIGEVYRVHDSEIGVDVALKVLHDGLIGSEDEFKRFATEIKLARRLSHQNIVRLYDIDRDGFTVYYAMQLLEGLTLRKIISLRVEKDQVFTLQEVEPIISQMVHALEYAHQFTFHGDIKPENVVVLPDLLKMTDFYLMGAVGKKKFLDRQRSNSDTLRYLAPEVRYEKENIGNRADIYSLGVILVEMLTGKAYDGGPVSITDTGKALSSGIDALCRKALSEDPFQRQETVTEFLKDIVKAIEESLSAPPPQEEPAPKSGEEKPREEFLPEAEFQEVEDFEIEQIAGEPAAGEKPVEKPAEVQAEEPRTPPAPPPAPQPVAESSRRVSFGLEEELLPASRGEITAEPPPPPAEFSEPEILEEEPLEAIPEAVPRTPQAETPRAPEPAPVAPVPQPAPFVEAARPAPVVPQQPVVQPQPVIQPAPVVQPQPAAYVPPAAPAPLPAPAPAAPSPSYVHAPAPSHPPAPRPVPTQAAVSSSGPFLQEKPRVPTVIVKSQRRHLVTMLVLFAVAMVVLIGGAYIIWNKMESQRVSERAMLEEQRKRLEDQRQSIENAQKELQAQLTDAKRVAEEKNTKEPAAAPVAKQEPGFEEKKVAEIEAQLARLREQQVATVRKQAEIDVKIEPKAPPKTDDRRAKAEEDRKKAAEDRKAAAEERKASLEAKKAEKAETAAKKAEEAKLKKEEAAKKVEEDRIRKEEAAKKAEEDRKAAEAARVPTCPKGMIMIPAGKFKIGSAANDPMKGMGEKNNDLVDQAAYCVDTYEFPNKSGKLPTVNVSYNGAEASCKKAGKRLCTEAEWEKACKGPGGLRYPYGNTWEQESCNQADDQGNKKQVGPAGSFQKCRSGYGVVDMSGNVAEWVDTGGGNKALKGGGADKPNFSVRCAARVSADPGKTGPTFGFRCCAEPE